MCARYNVFKYLLSLYLTKFTIFFCCRNFYGFRPFNGAAKINVQKQKEFIKKIVWVLLTNIVYYNMKMEALQSL